MDRVLIFFLSYTYICVFERLLYVFGEVIFIVVFIVFFSWYSGGEDLVVVRSLGFVLLGCVGRFFCRRGGGGGGGGGGGCRFSLYRIRSRFVGRVFALERRLFVEDFG